MAPGYTSEKDELLKEQFRQAQGSVDRAKEVLRNAGFRVSGRVIDAAIEWHADMIVLGSHGQRGIKRFLLGSVAECHSPQCSLFGNDCTAATYQLRIGPPNRKREQKIFFGIDRCCYASAISCSRTSLLWFGYFRKHR